MSHKTQIAYEHAFRYFDKNIFSLKCKSYTTNYERAMRNALRIVHPDVMQFACYFHFCQAVKKRAWQTHDFVWLIRSCESARFVYYRLHCLPLLPAEKIKEMFYELKSEAYKNNRAIFRPFLNYFQKQWIQNVS